MLIKKRMIQKEKRKRLNNNNTMKKLGFIKKIYDNMQEKMRKWMN